QVGQRMVLRPCRPKRSVRAYVACILLPPTLPPNYPGSARNGGSRSGLCNTEVPMKWAFPPLTDPPWDGRRAFLNRRSEVRASRDRNLPPDYGATRPWRRQGGVSYATSFLAVAGRNDFWVMDLP